MARKLTQPCHAVGRCTPTIIRLHRTANTVSRPHRLTQCDSRGPGGRTWLLFEAMRLPLSSVGISSPINSCMTSSTVMMPSMSTIGGIVGNSRKSPAVPNTSLVSPSSCNQLCCEDSTDCYYCKTLVVKTEDKRPTYRLKLRSESCEWLPYTCRCRTQALLNAESQMPNVSSASGTDLNSPGAKSLAESQPVA